MKDAFGGGTIPPQLDFFNGGEHLSDNFKHGCNFDRLMMKILDLMIFFARIEVKIL